mgnify:CR=1 FL=1
MERTTNHQWHENTYRQRRAYHHSTGGVLSMARRRRDQRTALVLAAALALIFFACFGLYTGVSRTVRKWQAGRAAAAAAPAALPAATPAVIYPADTRPVHILLLGSDQRGDDRSYRTDVIVLVRLDPAKGTASAVSFPRDLWVEPPTLYPMKINMIQAIGGFDAMAAMFETNFGVRPDYYVLTNFSGFTHLIDSLGGIDVHIGQPLTDSCDLPQAQGGICHVDEGVLPMDGATALWYARSRASTSDYDRLRRAQEVVQAVFVRMMSLDALTRLPEYYEIISQDVETNMTLGDIAPLAPFAVRLFQDPARIRRFVINEEQAYPSWSWDGMWILVPDPGAVRALLAEAGIP